MCGIVGAIARRNIVPVLVEGLKRLEYRGYDSSGIAVHVGSDITRVRRVGRVAEMEAAAAAAEVEAEAAAAALLAELDEELETANTTRKKSKKKKFKGRPK